MLEPTTDWGKKLLERSWWDAGMRGHFTRLSNTTGPEDMAYAIVGIEAEARKRALAEVYGYTTHVLGRISREVEGLRREKPWPIFVTAADMAEAARTANNNVVDDVLAIVGRGGNG